VTDELLLERVRSKLGHYPGQAGAINFMVGDGIVTLRGSVGAKDGPRILRAVKFIRGVKSIDNQLELRNEPEGESSLESTPNPFGTQPEPAGGV
jgi:osmotically-inducible protein OsmY